MTTTSRIFELCEGRLLLKKGNDVASRAHLIQYDHELQEQIIAQKAYLAEAKLLGSKDVLSAVGGIEILSIMARVASDKGLEAEYYHAFDRFSKEFIPRFREAIRREGGLR